jgi:hypothetical protein
MKKGEKGAKKPLFRPGKKIPNTLLLPAPPHNSVGAQLQRLAHGHGRAAENP